MGRIPRLLIGALGVVAAAVMLTLLAVPAGAQRHFVGPLAAGQSALTDPYVSPVRCPAAAHAGCTKDPMEPPPDNRSEACATLRAQQAQQNIGPADIDARRILATRAQAVCRLHPTGSARCNVDPDYCVAVP